MKKLLFIGVLLLIMGDLYAQQGPSNQGRTTQQIQNQRIQIDPRILKPDPRLQLGVCSPIGRFGCDTERSRFRRCEQNGFWGRWIRVEGRDAEIIESCSRFVTGRCTPGRYACNFRDGYYNICGEDGMWHEGGQCPRNPDGRTFNCRALPPSVLAMCEQAMGECWPGEARCSNDGGYNQCDDHGNYSIGDTLSRDATAYLNHCVYPSR